MRPAHRPLAAAERQAIAAGSWFCSLPPALRHDLLRLMQARRLADGECVFARGDALAAWHACVAGAVRISATAANGKALTLTVVRPGRWFGDPPLADDVRTHDAHAHGATTVACIARADLQQVAHVHAELYPALLRLQAVRLRQAFSVVEELASLGLRARLARQLLYLTRTHGVPCRGGEVRIGLRVRQDLLAQMLGCSRQRVNEQLMALSRADLIRREAGSLVVRDRTLLQQFADASP